jgi:hypothetical protein
MKMVTNRRSIQWSGGRRMRTCFTTFDGERDQPEEKNPDRQHRGSNAQTQ